ncbi:hypothetical protein GF402_03940 [Candidatus Fermentibacteria bacterium]|nr:hypothetical protein [Candidatus Fermentibacteria bacterium]
MLTFLPSWSLRQVFLRCALPLAIGVQVAGVICIEPINMDSHEYIALARGLCEHQEYSAPRGLSGVDSFTGESPTRLRQPGYPVFLAFFYWVLGQKVLVVQIAQMVLNCLALWFMLTAADCLLDGKLMPWAAVFAVLYFPWLILSSMILAESLFIVLLWSAVLAMAKSVVLDGKRCYLFSGILMGAAVMVKPIGLPVLLLSAVPIAVVLGLREGLRSWSLVVTGCLICVVPWAIRNYAALGEITVLPSTSGYNLWVAARPLGAEWWDSSEEFTWATEDWKRYYIDRRASERFRELAIARLEVDGAFVVAGRALLRTFSAWLRFPGTGNRVGWNPSYVSLTAVQLAMVVLAILGIIRLRNRRSLFLLLPVVALTACLPVSKGLTRYLLPGMPGVALLSGHGLLSMLRLDVRRGEGVGNKP